MGFLSFAATHPGTGTSHKVGSKVHFIQAQVVPWPLLGQTSCPTMSEGGDRSPGGSGTYMHKVPDPSTSQHKASFWDKLNELIKLCHLFKKCFLNWFLRERGKEREIEAAMRDNIHRLPPKQSAPPPIHRELAHNLGRHPLGREPRPLGAWASQSTEPPWLGSVILSEIVEMLQSSVI